MNLRHIALASAFCFSLLTTHHSLLQAADRTAAWQSVANAQQKGQPQTASAALDKIIAAALADNAAPEALRAILIKIQIDASKENYRTQAAAQIRALNAYLSDTPPVTLPASMRPLLEAALAKQWWNYYQQNRWQLLQRTQTAESPSDDFLTWDARRVLAETANHFEAALADPAALQRTPIATLEPLLAAGTLPDTYRPTLYDFLVHEAIAFYSAGEQGIAKSEDAFEPTADSPILGTLEEFLAWNPANPGTAGVPPALRAIQLYQQLLRFHLNAPAPRLALADADLARLNWAAGLLGEPARERHLAALRAFIERATANEPSVALAASLKLAELLENDDPAAAVAIAQTAIDANRETSSPLAATKNTANSLRNLLARIKTISLQSITTETTWPLDPAATAPRITINYRNHTRVHFRAYALNWGKISETYKALVTFDARDQWKENKKQKRPVAKTWNAALPATPDYRHREEKLPAPRDLKPGYYLIVASLDKNFSDNDNIISATTVWVTDLALLHDGYDQRAKRISGYVVNTVTGAPIANATVSAWFDDGSKDKPMQRATTTAEGAFTLANENAPDNRYTPLRILQARTPEGQTIATNNTNSYRYRPETTDETQLHITFFTDRALYRPGQTIQFKGVVMSANQQRADYRLATKRPVTVVINDPNGKEAGKLNLITNDYGSITGSFTIPAGRLTGYYSIYTTTGESGGTSINIEEYKRPKFEVTLPAPATAPKLNDTATLTGTATAYTGAPIDGAKVTWRVQRDVRWPRWCWWSIFTPSQPRAIAHGTATTDASGKFPIEFTALPDLTINAKDEPIFNYTITAEVTDTTGETRTATRTVSVGYTALAADIASEGDWQTAAQPISLKLKTTTLDGEPQTATGKVEFHALKQPAAVPQPLLNNRDYYYHRSIATKRPAPDANSPETRDWPIEEQPAATQTFATDAKTGLATLTQKLPAGIYRAIVTTADRFGKPVTAQTDIRVLAPEAKTHPIKEPLLLAAPAWTVQPGDTINALWSSGYDTARARVSIEQDGKILRAFWTNSDVTQQRIPIEITESMRGGITLRVVQVRDNRLATETRRIDIPWDNKKLKITWGHFNSKLTPGGRETWTAKIVGASLATPGSTSTGLQPVSAEMVAALYDASLDQYYPHNWPDRIAPFRYENTYTANWTLSNSTTYFSTLVSKIDINTFNVRWRQPYRYWNYRTSSDGDDDTIALERFNVTGGAGYLSFGSPAGAPMMTKSMAVPASTPAQARVGGVIATDYFGDAPVGNVNDKLKQLPGVDVGDDTQAQPDLTTITARKNLNETAFFYPQLLTDPDGSVRIEFTAPEALTRWKFLGFAHDKQLRSALLTDTAVTAKDLMVQPNPPRFLREGDTVEFTVKVTNMTDTPQQGTAQLSFADASSLESVDLFADEGAAEKSQISNSKLQKNSKSQNPKSQTQSFTLAPNSSQTLSWRITIPDGQGFLTYKAVASTGAVSDGEEGFLPVLSRRQLVTESIALPIRDAGTRTFTFGKLAASGTDTTLRNESLTVQMTSNPAWYAVLALPSLMEYPYECSEQIFNRYYANTLAAHIANSDPKIARVFEQWRNTPALESPLLKNEDLKSVLIEETPWLRTATRESEQRRAIGQLFDANRTAAQTASIIATLAERQGSDGLWPWFPGARGSEYITRYLVAGFARLRHFGITPDPRADAMIKRAIPALDAALAKRHAEILASKNFKPDANYLTTSDVYQLYTRNFFAKEIPVPATAREAYDYFLEQTRMHWTKLPRQSQGHAALALHRAGLPEQAQLITTSLKQRAKNHDELGMYWADTERGWFWWQAPIETQSLMIEVFDEVARDAQAVSDLQLWLLKQKQTQAWPSTKATADAVYALLLRGTDKLASDAIVTVSLGDKKIEPAKTEAGTGFYTERIPGPNITPAMGEEITVTKTDAGPAWGSVTWQYFQSIDKITPHEGTPLTLKKTIYKQINTASGPTLVSLSSTTLNPGDTLIVRIELRTDRDMEFVHLKDQRGSGTEPVNVLSGYRWKNGLGFYESTRDTATHFFIDYLNAGTYVFEYPIRVQLRGRYESGIAEIQCMYAPEYNSHSASTTLVVE